MRWPIVGKLCWLHALVLQHDVEELPTMAPSLDARVNVEVEHAHWLDFLYFSAPPANEQLLHANFEEPDTLIALSSNKDDMAICTKFADRCDLTGQSLSLVSREIGLGVDSLTFALDRPIESMTWTN